jgi:hypothetical protein
LAKLEKRLAGIWLFGNGRPVSGSRIARRIGDAAEQRPIGLRAQPLVAAEDEGAVLDDRAAGRHACLRLVARLLPEIVLGIQGVVAAIVVRRRAESIGPRLGDDGDDGLSLSVLGGERIAQDVHLLDGVERRVQRQVVEAKRADVDAVDRVVGRTVAAAFNRHVLAAAAAGGAELRAAVERLRRDARRERREGERVAAGDRQILDRLLANRLADRRVRDLKQR